MAADARWLADDLATVTAQRPALVRTELEARALVMRRALDLGETAVAQAAAELIDRRAGSEQGTPGLSPELLWDHRVDARVGDRKSTRLNSSHVAISYAVFCLKK